MELKEVLKLVNGGEVEIRPMRKGSIVRGTSYQLLQTLSETHQKQEVEALAADGSTTMILVQETPLNDKVTRSDARAIITKEYGHMFTVEWINVCINGMFEKNPSLDAIDVLSEFIARSTLVI